MGSDGFIIKIDHFIKEFSNKINNQILENLFGKMEILMRGTGKWEDSMGKVLSFITVYYYFY